jgi:hypothetical protein
MVMRKLVAMIVTGLALVVLSVVPADATAWWLQYSDRSTGQCMDMAGGNYDGALVSEDPCLSPIGSGSSHQLFQLAAAGDGNSLLIVQSSGKCVRLVGDYAGPDASGPIEQWTCGGSVTQEWQTPVVKENANGSVDIMFRNAATGICVSSNGGSHFNPLMALPCNSADARQVWHQHLREGGGHSF